MLRCLHINQKVTKFKNEKYLAYPLEISHVPLEVRIPQVGNAELTYIVLEGRLMR